MQAGFLDYRVSTPGKQHTLAQRAYQLLFLAFFASALCLLLSAAPSAPANLVPLLETALIVLGALLTVASLARRLPVENAIMACLYVVVISFVMQIIGLKTGIPFGRFIYAESFGPQLFHVPWPIPLVWMIFILNSRGVAKLILRPWRKTKNYGFWIMGVTCLLAVALDFGLEPFATRIQQLWAWQTTGNSLSWYDSPWTNFLGWGVTTLLILCFTTLWLINKRVSQTEIPDYPPLPLWLVINFLLAAINALHGLWSAAGLGLVFGTLVLLLVNRGARQTIQP